MISFSPKFVNLDSDPHGSAFILPPGSGPAFSKTPGSRSANNECGSTALIRIMPVLYETINNTSLSISIKQDRKNTNLPLRFEYNRKNTTLRYGIKQKPSKYNFCNYNITSSIADPEPTLRFCQLGSESLLTLKLANKISTKHLKN